MDFVVGLSVRDPQHDHIEDFQIFFQNFLNFIFFGIFKIFRFFTENMFGSIEKIFSEKVGKFSNIKVDAKNHCGSTATTDHFQPLKITLQHL